MRSLLWRIIFLYFLSLLLPGAASFSDELGENNKPVVHSSNPDRVCPVLGSQDWRAWLNKMPGDTSSQLHLSGEIELPSPGYTVSVRVGPLDRMRPPTQIMVLEIEPPAGPAAAVMTSRTVTYAGPALVAKYAGIRVVCGSDPIASIDTVENVH